MNPRVEKKLHDVLEQGRRIAEVVDSSSHEQLVSDWRMQYAVQKALEIVAEALSAAVKIDPALTDRLPDVRRYIAMRNHLTHQYWDVDYLIVWKTCVNDVPLLIQAVDRILEPIQDERIQSDDWFDE